MPRSGCDAEVAPLDGLAGAVAAEWDVGPELDPHEAAATRARLTVKVAQTRGRIRISRPPNTEVLTPPNPITATFR
jgi:hypothetical protein